jgi:hypothetical protein
MTKASVEGADRLASTLHGAAKDLDDLTAVGRAIERDLLPRIQARTPRRSGRLRGSIRGKPTKTGIDFGSPLVYGNPIHWGWPARHIAAQRFIWDVVTSSTEAIVGKYEDEVDRILSHVEGV